MKIRALGTWEEVRHQKGIEEQNQRWGPQKTLEYILLLISLPFPSSQEVILPWVVVVGLPTLRNDTLVFVPGRSKFFSYISSTTSHQPGEAEDWLVWDDCSHSTDESSKAKDS